MPQAIHAMAFNAFGDQLAVARANGDLEIWSVGKKWHLKYVINGSDNSKISALKWSTSGRLFVASLDGTLWETDFLYLRRKNVVDSSGGPIWCLAINDPAELLATGCEDGRIRVFSYQNDDLYFRKGFVSTGSRVVSVAWHIKSNKMFSGGSDGIIHCWNATSGRNESRITLETLAKQKCVIWSLLVLNDLTIVSGDSHGNLNFWSGETGTLLQKFSHLTADILTLCTDASNSVLFASGIDNQVVQFKHVVEHESCWSYCYSHRAHTHDVRALALSNAKRPILVSGGIDTQLVWYHSESFNIHRPSKLASMPYPRTIFLSSDKRTLLVQKSKALDLWGLGFIGNDSKQQKLLLEMQMNDSFNISCSALSLNSQYVACSTPNELKLFSLDVSNGFQPRKLKLPPNALAPCRALLFSPDSTRLIVAVDTHEIKVFDLKKMEVLKVFKSENSHPILNLAVSSDGQWLGSGDANNNISIYNLDSMQFFCHLPRPNEMHTSIAFNPTGKILVVTLVSNNFISYDVEKKGLSEWCRQHHDHLPTALTEGKNIKGMAFDPVHPNYLYLYSQTNLYQLDMDESTLKKSSDKAFEATRKSKKPRQEQPENIEHEKQPTNSTATEESQKSSTLCKSIHRYRPLAFVDFLNSNEMVVVETPWLKVLSRLPGALHRHKYGK
jgi:U3 small nucleolar RNA-associated protein 4